jgi:glucokinase
MINYSVKFFNEERLNQKFNNYVLGVDIGGTNTNLAIAGVEQNKPILLFSLNFKSRDIESLIPAIDQALDFSKNKYDINIDHACIGAAGVVSSSRDYAELTNVEWNVSTKDLIEQTSLKSAFLINDFQAVGYGINFLNLEEQKDIFKVRDCKTDISSNDTRAIIGAGSGLGKCILIYDKNADAFIPIPSEGGHSDFPVQNDFEMKLIHFIKKLSGTEKNNLL